jgi:hypothetical protein
MLLGEGGGEGVRVRCVCGGGGGEGGTSNAIECLIECNQDQDPLELSDVVIVVRVLEMNLKTISIRQEIRIRSSSSFPSSCPSPCY